MTVGTLFDFLTFKVPALNRHIHNGMEQKRPISKIWPVKEMEEGFASNPENFVAFGVLSLG